MAKPVVIAGALDTKGAEFAFVRDLLHAQGVATILVDFGVLGDPPFPPDVSNDAVARAGGSTIAELRSHADKTTAMRTMTAGLAQVVADLYAQGRLGGMLGMAGSGGTAIATAAMQMIPGVDLALCRTPDIMADAAYCIFTADGLETGNFYIDDTVLAQHGITELDRYAVTPGNKNFLPDFFVD